MKIRSFISGLPVLDQQGEETQKLFAEQSVLVVLEKMLAHQNISFFIYRNEECIGVVYLQDLILFLVNEPKYGLFFHKLNFELESAVTVLMRMKKSRTDTISSIPYLEKIYALLDYNIKPLMNQDLLEILISSKTQALAIYTSPKINIELANNMMIGFWGKNKSIIGKSMKDAVPELENQPFIGLIKKVWETGVTYEAKNTPASLMLNGKIQVSYFNFCYRAIKNTDGKVNCILHYATDVTKSVLNKKNSS